MELQLRGNLPELHGITPGGYVQKYIDQECIRQMAPYTPFLSGTLERSATAGSVIGSGKIVQQTPYGRFQYYGKVMIDPNTGSTWAPMYGRKEVTDRELQHQKSRHPKAGSYWFERMKADKRTVILRGAQTLIGRGHI